jgi:hypothetical protein
MEMTYKKSLVTENNKLGYIIRQVNRKLIELQEFLSGLTEKELDSKNVQKTDEHSQATIVHQQDVQIHCR